MLGESIFHYRIEERIGAGGMGEVFRAFDTKLQRRVAIKRLHSDLSDDPVYRRRFLKEAQLGAQIHHQGVAAIHDVFEKDSELFLVLEYVEGLTLGTAGVKRTDVGAFLKIATKCVEALIAAHAIGLVHRDIKPANIMLTPTGEVKILDFGLAKRSKEGPHDPEAITESTEEHGIQGTLAYMPPEVLLGREADHRADLFSLGVVFYQVLTGTHPFHAGTGPNTINRILHSNPGPMVRVNPAVPIELEECVFRLMEKNPELRHASARDLLAHLRRIERNVSSPFLALPSGQPRRLPRNRRRLSLGLLGLAAIGVPAFLFIDRLLPPSMPDHPVVAVLPFESIPDETVSAAFARGLSEMVCRRLSSLSIGRPFVVIPLVRRFQTPQETEALGANLVLTGFSEVRAGSVTVALQLLASETGRELFREEIQSSLSRPADLELEILDKSLRLLDAGRAPPNRLLLPVARSYPHSQAAYDYFLRGLGRSLDGDDSHSIENLRRALQLAPHFPLAKTYLGLALLRSEGPEDEPPSQEAEQLCREARNLDGRLQTADLCLARAVLARGDLTAAQTYYESALQKGPLDWDVLNGLRRLARRLGNLDEMIPPLERAIEREPHFWLGYEFLANVHYVRGRFGEAVQHQQMVAALAPKRSSSYTHLGVYYDLLGCFEQAVAAYEKALTLGRTSRVYTNLATTRFYAGQYPEALEAAQEAKLYLDHEGRLSYVESGNLGDIYYWSPGGNRETGVEFYREALDLVDRQLNANPSDIGALQSRCWYLAMLEETESARLCLDTLLESPHLDYDSCYKVALTYQRLGLGEEALEYLERSLELGKLAAPILNEPIFRGNQEVQDLVRLYSREEPLCP